MECFMLRVSANKLLIALWKRGHGLLKFVCDIIVVFSQTAWIGTIHCAVYMACDDGNLLESLKGVIVGFDWGPPQDSSMPQ